jgi:hypothetical protein
MRPVIAGMCKYESLKNCEVDLEDLSRMNDALDVKEENETRVREANNER